MTKKYYGLKTINSDGTSHGGFKWNLKIGNRITAPDWTDEKECGGGIHYLLNGEGDGYLLSSDEDAIWLVVSADEYVDIDGKVKSPWVDIEYFGDRKTATKKIYELCGNVSCAYGHLTSGDKGLSTSGYCGRSTSGDRGQSISGGSGRSTSGFKGQSTSGSYGHSTSGDCGQSISGFKGRSTSGYKGHSTSGDWGHSTSGDWGHSTSGHWGHSTSGDRGQSMSRFSEEITVGRFGACLNYGPDCVWIARHDTVLLMHWEEQKTLRTKILYGNNYEDGQKIIIENGEVQDEHK